jgi:hypothetical protein
MIEELYDKNDKREGDSLWKKTMMMTMIILK